MRTILKISLILLFHITANAQNFVDSVPDWFTSTPSVPGKIVGVGSGNSMNMEMALQKADMDAKVKLASKVKPVITTITTKIDSSFRGDELVIQKVTIIRNKVAATLSDVRVERKVFMKDGDRFTAYIMLSTDEKSVKSTFVEMIDHESAVKQALADKGLYQTLLDWAK
jgi:hypothetical protein